MVKKKNQNRVLSVDCWGFPFPSLFKKVQFWNQNPYLTTTTTTETKFQIHISIPSSSLPPTHKYKTLQFSKPKNLEPKSKTHFSNPLKTHFPYSHSLNKQTNKHRFVWKIWILYFHGNPKTQLCSFGFHHSRRNLWRVFTIERNSWRVFSIFAFWNPRWPFFGPYTLNSKWVFSIWPIYGCSAVKLNWVFLNFTSHQWNPKWVFFFFFGYGNRNPRWLSQLPSLVWWRRRCSWGRRRAITLFPKSLIG